jgi:nicotinate-nucleotide adenylyltransferase
MIELAIAPNSKYRLNTLEIERGGHSFMIDSLRQIRTQFQSDTIILILGADAFNQFPSWKSPGEILGLVHLVVCRRPGVELDRSIYADHWVNSRQMLESQCNACILPLEIEENPCSSTLVRELLSQKNQASRCLPAAVYQFIESNHLYEQN